MENKCNNKEQKTKCLIPKPGESHTLHQEMTSLVPSGCKSGYECVGETGLENGWANYLWFFQLITSVKKEKYIINNLTDFVKASVKI